MGNKDDIFSVDASEMKKLAEDMKVYVTWAKGASKKKIDYWGRVLLAEVQKNASGRPGPRVGYGQYRSSIKLDTAEVMGQPTSTVSSDAPQAHRLEYGFVGRDSKGRIYHQPPFPHFGPALDKLAPDMQKDMADDIIRWWPNGNP